jgi:hypothetical protein
MNKQFLVFLAFGLVLVAAVIGFTLVGTKGAHLTLEGKILKVRTLETSDKDSIVVVDFRVTNKSKVQFMVREGTIRITGPDGKETEGETIARADMNRVFDYYKLLGPKFNEVLIMRDKISGGQRIDRMIAARLTVPAADAEQRRNLTLTLTDIDGPAFSFSER